MIYWKILIIVYKLKIMFQNLEFLISENILINKKQQEIKHHSINFYSDMENILSLISKIVSEAHESSLHFHQIVLRYINLSVKPSNTIEKEVLSEINQKVMFYTENFIKS